MNIHHGRNSLGAERLRVENQVVAIHVFLIVEFDIPLLTVQGEGENLIERVRRIGEVGHTDEFVHLASGDIFHRASVGYLVAIVF